MTGCAPDARRAARVQIEQAIARGWPVSRIMREQGVTYLHVKRVFDGMLYEPPARQPHGTHAAYNRHRLAGENPCNRCAVGEQAFQEAANLRRERTDALRARQAEAARAYRRRRSVAS